MVQIHRCTSGAEAAKNVRKGRNFKFDPYKVRILKNHPSWSKLLQSVLLMPIGRDQKTQVRVGSWEKRRSGKPGDTAEQIPKEMQREGMFLKFEPSKVSSES